MNAPMTEAQRLEAILIMEGMPAEPTLEVDSPDYQFLQEDEATLAADLACQSEHDRVANELNLDQLTPVDTFMAARAPVEYRWQDDAKDAE